LGFDGTKKIEEDKNKEKIYITGKFYFKFVNILNF